MIGVCCGLVSGSSFVALLALQLPHRRWPNHSATGLNAGILWRRGVPEKYGNWNSIYRRFRRWSASGVRESGAVALADTMAVSGHCNIDSTTVRAPVSAAGEKGGFIDEFLAARGAGSPVKFLVSQMPAAAPSPSTSRPAKGRIAKTTTSLINLPERAPKALRADKGYDTDATRNDLKRRRINPVIPPRSNRKAIIRYIKRLYRERNRITR